MAGLSEQQLNDLMEAARAALDYLDSEHFPHKAPSGADRKPVVVILQQALDQAEKKQGPG